MIADLGTRRNTSLDVIKPDSPWFKGYPWMWKHSSTFPTRSPEDISLDQSQLQQASKEVRAVQVHHSSSAQDQLQRRYVFSSYLIDPNKHRFSTVVRIMALVFKFIILQSRVETIYFFSYTIKMYQNFTKSFSYFRFFASTSRAILLQKGNI